MNRKHFIHVLKFPNGRFQDRVAPWMLACFDPEIAADKLERNDRFIEEALELVQASDYPRDRAHALVEYVYGRPQGDINQEVGGVMVTLAAHCLAHGVDMHAAGEEELARINQPDIIVKIRAKQAAKPRGSALPVAPSPPSGGAQVETDSCPSCGALPCDWVDNPHVATPPSRPTVEAEIGAEEGFIAGWEACDRKWEGPSAAGYPTDVQEAWELCHLNSSATVGK